MAHVYTYEDGIFGSSVASTACGVSWVWHHLASAGPGWAIVPPVLLSCASLMGAIMSGRKLLLDMELAKAKAAQEARHAEELHAKALANQAAADGRSTERNARHSEDLHGHALTNQASEDVLAKARESRQSEDLHDHAIINQAAEEARKVDRSHTEGLDDPRRIENR